MRIVGLSFDPPEDNARFREDYGFGFELWSDRSRQLALHLGAARSERSRVASRHTAVLDRDGRLVLNYPQVLNVLGHPQQVFDDCEALFAS